MFLLIREIASLYIAHVTAHSVGDPKGVRALHKVLKYIDRRKTTIVRNGFGKWWLGNLVTKLGGKWEDYRCRGEIVDYSLEGDILIITQMTSHKAFAVNSLSFDFRQNAFSRYSWTVR